ncbi:hypothetical protein GCM10007183_17310 [Staphylococcus muscae]|uniref:Uncharacterized protein n=1 Tax=Staphylococcus muscae TaxID=1294 RepID=A0ABQ1HWJ1_9STAP|nr:hypothetical protein GCM10007183_17310 [Staphylococcus muscae]
MITTGVRVQLVHAMSTMVQNMAYRNITTSIKGWGILCVPAFRMLSYDYKSNAHIKIINQFIQSI